MNSQMPQQQFDWNRTKLCAAVAILTLLAGIAMVPPAWWPILFPRPFQSPVTPPSLPEPPVSVAEPRQNVCGEWLSATSRKQYNFVCQGKDSFQIYEVTGEGLNKTGSGNMSAGGDVDADLLSSPKNRRAHLRLRLSTDGRTMTGSWQGEDPRESGQLMFHRI
jgi:hypothetical protein